MLGLVAFSAEFLLGGHASAQIPEPGRPVCDDSIPGNCRRGSHSSPSSESPEERQARLQRKAEERAERNAEKEKQKADKKKTKEEAQQRKEASRQEAEAAQQRELEAQRQREIEAERQRQLAIEAQRLETAFDERKPAALSALKGFDGAPSGSSEVPVSLGLKEADDGKPAWDAHITDPQVAKVAKRLDSFVPPLPIPQEEASVTLKQIYLGEDRLLNTTDYVIAGLEITGSLSGAPFAGYKLLLMSTKTFIAGQNGAYLHLVKREQDYDAALQFLKNPAQSQQFAHLVDDIRQNRPLPAGVNPAMVKAARAITDPKLGNTKVVILDAMLSREAFSAMLRKASIEALSECASIKSDKLLKDMSSRRAALDSVLLEREQARKMLMEATTPQQREQWTAVIKRANHLSAAIYKTEQVTGAYVSKQIGDDIDQLATGILGQEAKMPDSE